MARKLKMRFDKKTIDHLGIKLYSSLPPVLAELISNAYDADAENVTIDIDYINKTIVVTDDGNGMDFSELENNYLVIGRNRREAEGTDKSPKKNRLVTGKKGLGKLAVFGVANVIEVSSTKDGFNNTFIMKYSDIKAMTGDEFNDYEPTIVNDNLQTKDPSGTTIKISDIGIQDITILDDLSVSLSKRFKFYDEADFRVLLSNENTGNQIEMVNGIYYESMEKEFTWKFPDDFSKEIASDNKLGFLNKLGITGALYTKPTPLQTKDLGFIVYSRGKLVQENGFFSDRSNDNFHKYVFGFFEIDAIDKHMSEDHVGTARRSVLWEQSKELTDIRDALNSLVNKVQNEWRKKRATVRAAEVKKALPDDFYDDISSEIDKRALEGLEQTLITNSSEDEDPSRIAGIMQSVKVLFRFETFKDYVAKMNAEDITGDSMEKLSKDWYAIETQELAKVATGRIKTIDKFEDFIKSNASETKYIQPFLEKFPWILEPRMTTFDREVTFDKILKEAFPDEKLNESNRRIDFLCANVNGEVYIIELKRPGIKLSTEEIMQAVRYRSFLSKQRPQLSEASIHTYLISDRTELGREAQDLYESLHKDGKITIKSYTEMLEQARQYHDNFIDAQLAIEEAKSATIPA